MTASPPTLRVRRLTDAARLPTKAHANDLGWDLYAAAPVQVAPGALARIATAIAVEFPTMIGGIVKDRSSLAVKGLHCLAGVIDPDYRGEIQVVVANLGPDSIQIEAGDRCAQLVLTHVVEAAIEGVEEVGATGRGEGGFGSSGR